MLSVCKSRSQVYQEALAEYVARCESTPVTATLDEVIGRLGDERDSWIDEAARSTLERSEW